MVLIIKSRYTFLERCADSFLEYRSNNKIDKNERNLDKHHVKLFNGFSISVIASGFKVGLGYSWVDAWVVNTKGKTRV